MRYDLDGSRSSIWIDATSSVHPIHTKATGATGWIDVELDGDGRVVADAPVSGRLTLPVDRLRSPNPLEVRELRRRIDAKRFPTIDGELRALRAGDQPGRYVATGDLTFHGVTRTYEDELTIAVADDGALRLEGASVFDVRDHDLEPPKILVLRVHPEVRVRVELLATPGA